MAHQPMSGGIETRISDGRPLGLDAKDRRVDAQIRHENAVQESLALVAELQNGSPTFRAVVNVIRNRLNTIASNDAIIQTHLSVLVDCRFKLEVLPRETEKFLRTVAGPSLSAFIEEPEVAPEGIPA